MLRSVLTLAAALTCAASFADPVAVLTGVGVAKDGDDILFGRVDVRLQGVAAPEMNTAEGREAKEALARLVDGLTVTCELDGTLAGKRPVGVCFVAGRDVGGLLIRAGFARDCPRYSRGRYQADEDFAISQGRSLKERYPLPSYC